MVGQAQGSLWRRGYWGSTVCTPFFAGYPMHLAGLSVFPRGLWSGACMPLPSTVSPSSAGIHIFPWENGHAEMPRANDLRLLRMFWIFKQEWSLGWISVWHLLPLGFLLYFQKASSFLFPTRYFLWFLCFLGKFIMREVQQIVNFDFFLATRGVRLILYLHTGNIVFICWFLRGFLSENWGNRG